MWIIPKHPLLISACAPDTEELTSDSKELSIMCEQSLLVKSKPTPSKTWLQRLKRDTSTRRLFGLILKPSRGASFTERWTSSAEASLVSHSAPQDGEQETATPDTYGHTSHEELESWADLPLFSSKTWREYSAPSSTAPSGQTHKERPFCNMSSASWSAWVIKQRQEYLARAKQVPPTSASACSYLVYEMTSAPRAALLFQDCSRTQSAEAWLTPTTQETPHPQATLTETGRRASADGTTSHSLNLCDAALLAQNTGAGWATPNANDDRPRGPNTTTALTYLSNQILEPTHGPADEEPRNTHGSPRESQSGSASEGWRTPSTMEAKRTTYKSMEKLLAVEQGHQVSLTAQVQAGRWATPSQGDGIRLGCETTDQWRARAEKKKEQGINLHRPLNIEALLDAETQTPSPTGQLNPRWVETLMGLPVGWTMVSCAAPWIIEPMNCGSSATELYQQQQSALSESSGSAWATPRAGACGMTARTSGRPIEKSGILQTQVYLEECKARGTPRLSTANAHPKAGARGPNTEYRLENQVLEESGDTWPTPQARDHKGSSGRSNKGLEIDLPTAVKTTTPTPAQGTPNNEPST